MSRPALTRWKQIDALFDEVMDLSPAKRAHRLDQACVGDPELRRAVERRLQALDEVEADAFLENREEFFDAKLPSIPEATAEALELGRFRILSELWHEPDRGVFRAHDEDSHREVLVLLLQGEEAPPLKRPFLYDVKGIGSVQHTHLTVHVEVGESQGIPFVAVEDERASSLAQLLRRSRGPMPEALPDFLALAGAVQALHDRGIAHKDIRPENVWITEKGTWTLTGVGTAPRLARQEVASEVIPYPLLGYAAPERLRGNDGDPRADVWSLGALLYTLLSGSPPFPSPTAFAVHAIKRLDPPPLPTSVPASLRLAVERALAKDPQHRYPDAGALADAVQGGKKQKRTTRPVSPVWLLGGAVLVVLLLVVLWLLVG
ncbi:MAG: serine/threonine-protein kinase [Bacteroidota bacterium]